VTFWRVFGEAALSGRCAPTADSRAAKQGPIRSAGGAGWDVLRQTCRVIESSRAGAEYELAEPLRVRRGLGGWLLFILDAMSLAVPADSKVEHQVKVRRGGAVVYRVRTESGLAYEEARRSITNDLEQLSVEEFDTQYGIRTSQEDERGA